MTKPFVRPELQQLLDMINGMDGPSFSEVGAVTAREMMQQMAGLNNPTGELAVMRDMTMTGPDGQSIPLRLYDCKAERGPSPVVVFFHGGGFVIGDVPYYDPLCANISRDLDMPVVSVEYRLAPEHKWPACPDDCEAAARWVASNPAELGRTAEGLILCGDSAGGNLTAVTAMALRDKPAAQPVLVQWQLYPVTDMSKHHESYDLFKEGYLLSAGDMDWFRDEYAADNTHWRASPLFGEVKGLAPAVVHTCSLDPLRDEGRALAAKMIVGGVPTIFLEAEGMVHGFATFRAALPSTGDDWAASVGAVKLLLGAKLGA
jgi:acetyl esterase